MPPRRRTAAADGVPFSPGQQSTESFVVRKQQATSWALDGLASSPELAKWGDQLHSKLRRWQRAFTAAMVALTIAVSVLVYQTAVYHSGSSLSTPFKESFDMLSGNSQQALQQLVTQGSKLIPEGSSIRDSYDKLSVSSQHALYNLVNSGLSLPSLLPHKQEPKDLLSTSNSDSKADKASIAQLTTDLRSARQENDMLTDLLQRSQEEVSMSQGRTHELLSSLARVEDDRSLLASQNAYLQSVVEKVPEAKECAQQMPACDEAPQCPVCDDVPCTAESLYGPFGNQGWLLGALAAAFLLFTGFLYSPGSALRPLKAVYRSCLPPKAKLHQVSRKISDTSASTNTDSSFSRNTSSGQDSLLNGLSDSELQQRWKECMEPISSRGPAAANAVANSKGSATPSQKASPAKSPPLQASPLKESPANGLSGPSTPRTLESESAESEADMREQIEALRAVATQRDGLEKDLKVAKADLSTTEGKLAETTASLESVKADLTEKTRLTSQLESQASHSQAVDELQQQHVNDIRAIETQLAQVKSDKAMAESSLNEKLAELAELTQQLTETRESDEAVLAQTRANAKRQKQELADAAASAQEAADVTQQQLRADVKRQKQELADAKSATDSAEAIVKQLTADAKRQKQDLADATSAKDRVGALLEEAKSELDRQQQITKDATSAKASLQAALDKASADAKQHQQKVINGLHADLESSVSAVQEELNETSDQLQETFERNDELEQQNEQMQSLKKQRSAELLDSMQRATAEYDSLRDQAEDHVHALELSLAEERHRTQSVSNQLQGSYLQVQTGPRAMMHSNSIPGTPRRSPGSPTGSSRSSGSRGSKGSRPTDFLTQLTDAQKRITTLEAELAAAKVTGSSAIPAPCLRCLSRDPVFNGMLAQINRQPSTFSQAWNATGEYNEVRSKAFASFVTDSGGTPRKAAASASASLPSHAVEVQSEVSSHAIEGAGALASHAVRESIPSHALEDEGLPSYALEHDVGSIGSPQSSVGSWRGRLDMHINLDSAIAQESSALSPRLSSPPRSLAQHPLSGSPAHPASGLNTARTPLSSHAVADSTESDSQLYTGQTPLSSHAVNPSSSSGSGTDEGFTPTSMQQEATGYL
ncbi:hypothetical protein WJX82_011153 [Trebouxia sp. C0006]